MLPGHVPAGRSTKNPSEPDPLPIFVYQCQHCGLRFEKLWRSQAAAAEGDSFACKGCGEPAEKQVTAANHTFAHKPTGPVPQNTGVHSIDYNYDRVIGRDAAEKWKQIEARDAEKRRVLGHNPGKDKSDLRRQLPEVGGGYEVMDDAARDMSARGRALNELAQKRMGPSPAKSGSSSEGVSNRES